MLGMCSPQISRASDSDSVKVDKSVLNLEPTKKSRKEKTDMDYRQVFSCYPIKALSNYIMLGYERQVGDKHVLKIAAGYVSFEDQLASTNFDFEVKDYSGFRFDMSLKYFVGENNPVFNGIYFSPYVSFKNSKFMYNDFNDFQFPSDIWEEGSATSFHGGFIFGYQLPIGESFTIDGYVGNVLKRSSGNYKEATRLFDSYKNNIGLIGGITVGFGF